MDNKLTPNKIQRLMHLAEDRSFNIPRRLLINDEDLKKIASHPIPQEKSTTNTSSGILDLEHVEGFGESTLGNMSLSKSTAFNPGEMTGRSTGAEEVITQSIAMNVPKTQELYRHSIALDSLTSQLDKQTNEIQNIMRNSIASNYSFQSKRNLTADEASFVVKEAPLPILPSQQANFVDSVSMNNSDLSVGAYFKNRCPDMRIILGKTDSPDRSAIPSISEVSTSSQLDPVGHSTNLYKMDQTLDSIPVKQSRNATEKLPEKNVNLNNTKNFENTTTYEIVKTENPIFNKLEKQDNMNKTQDKKQMAPPAVPTSHKPISSGSKPTDILLRNLQSSLRIATEDTEGEENSLSLSKIADFLTGKQSNISVTEMLLLNQRKYNKKSPLAELQINQNTKLKEDVQVTHLKDTRDVATASSAGSLSTVISMDKYRESKDIPAVVVTEHSLNSHEIEKIETKSKASSIKSRSPSSKTQSTLSTVQENYASFNKGSPLQTSRGEANTSHVPSPSNEYKELDKSVNWQEVLRHRHMKQEILAKEQWVEIKTTVASGYVGVSCPVTLSVKTLTDSWLTAKFQFDELPNLTIELPRLPLLLSPGKSEQFTLHVTSNVEITTDLPFTMILKDAYVEGDIEQKECVSIDIKMPIVQAMSIDGINRINFPAVQEKTTFTKSFVLISDCAADLQLDLSVVEGESMFAIKNVVEIKKSDVNKVLMENLSGEEMKGRGKKTMSKQLCRLTSGNAIKVIISFNAPKLCERQISDTPLTFNGVLNVNLYGINTTLRKIDLIASVGTVNLVVKMPGSKLQLNEEPTTLILSNTGSIQGTWSVKFMASQNAQKFPFKICPTKFDIRPQGSTTLTMSYGGTEDGVAEATVAFEDVMTGNKTLINICGGSEKPKTFPVKTNHNVMSWVRVGRKELSLKNVLNKKIHLRCHVTGDGFTIDLPGMESRGTYLISLGPNECRPLPILFNANSCTPHAATLNLVYDKNNEFSRTVRLFGCAGASALRWHGLVTYGDTALVRAPSRADVALGLYNRAAAAAFVHARVHFNLQFRSVAQFCQLTGARAVVPARGKHSLLLKLEWAQVERRAREADGSALATVTILTGAEVTRRRILKVIKNESNGELDLSLLPEHLRELAGPFEGENPHIDNQLSHFNEAKSSLNELIGGLHEMTAQIDLPQDFAEEYTIVVSDDTVLEHHTLRD